MERVDLVIIGATSGEITPLSGSLKPTSSVAAEAPRIESPGSGSAPGAALTWGAGNPLPGFAPGERQVEIAGNLFTTYVYRDLKLLVGTTGIGKVNAAAVAAALLSEFKPGEVWNVGCAGAYGGCGLEIGDVLIAENCICGDEGILGKKGPMPTSSLKIPLILRNGVPFYDCFPLDEFLARRRIRALLPAGAYGADRDRGVHKGGRFKVQYGPTLTVSMTSGDIDTAEARFGRFGALAENMEASAIAQTCMLFNAAFLEIRGISNVAGVRDKAKWDIGAAIQNCHLVVKCLLDNEPRAEV